MDSWLVFRRNRVVLNQWTKRNDWSFKMVSQNVSRMVSSRQTRDLECFAERCSIPWNLPTNFHLDLIATIRQRCLLLLCALLFQQSHLFPICVVSTYNDSRKDLHRLCQIPGNCQCKCERIGDCSVESLILLAALSAPLRPSAFLSPLSTELALRFRSLIPLLIKLSTRWILPF